jgi:4-hydroxybenzoate polyprenyltransferase
MSHVRLLLTALRPYQWLKNLLILVPVLAAHRLNRETFLATALAFVSYSLCASGGYVLNDLLDVKADQQHSRKRNRPFASGGLSRRAGVLVVAAGWVAGFGIALLFLPPGFAWVMAIYLLATAAYSIRFKREPVLDVMILAGLYVLRVIAGGVAVGISISTWLLAFTLFVSLSLAFLKRFIEVREFETRNGVGAEVPGRGYRSDDAAWLHSVGLSSSYLAAVVLAIYVNNADVAHLYSHPERLLLICPVLLFWATRTWLRAHRRLLHDDPVVAVARDPATYVMAAISAAVVLSAV